MKFEEIISSFVMVIVTGLVLVGFTIAWYTNNNLPAVTGIEVQAAEMGSVQVALKPEAEGGVDITKLEGVAKYAELGMAEYTNFSTQDKGELAPGVSGQVTFYVKPITSAVTGCIISPKVRISRDGSAWYPVIESVDGGMEDAAGADSESGSDETGSGTESTEESSASGSEIGSTEESSASGSETGSTDGSSESGSESDGSGGTDNSGSSDSVNGGAGDALTIEELYMLANAHIEFFMLAEDGTLQQITADTPYKLVWGDGEGEAEPLTEQKAVIYWKWHYEYPFTAEEEATLTAAQKEEYIDKYDEEDMTIGNNISAMKFYFTFSAQ